MRTGVKVALIVETSSGYLFGERSTAFLHGGDSEQEFSHALTWRSLPPSSSLRAAAQMSIVPFSIAATE